MRQRGRAASLISINSVLSVGAGAFDVQQGWDRVFLRFLSNMDASLFWKRSSEPKVTDLGIRS